MTRYLAERPTLELADDLFVSQAIDYFKAHHAERGPSWAAVRTANMIEDRLTETQTGMRRPQAFGVRALRAHWDEVAESHRPQAVDIARLMRDGCWEDARCALAACLAVAESLAVA